MNLFSLLKVHMPGQETDRNLSDECFLCIQMEAATQAGMGYGQERYKTRADGSSNKHPFAIVLS